MYDLLESENNYYLVLDYCDDGDLEAYISRNYPKGMGLQKSLEIMK